MILIAYVAPFYYFISYIYASEPNLLLLLRDSTFKRKNFFKIILKLDIIRDILFLVLTRKQRFEKIKVKKLLTPKWAM